MIYIAACETRADKWAPENKRANLAITHLNDTGTFDGYASLFNVADLSRDVVAPGAFSASLRKRGAAGVKLLWQHNPAEPIGVWTSIVEDGKGLKVQGRLNLAVARAREILALMRDGVIDGLSIGFRTEKAVKDPKSGIRRLHKLDLWEISLVTFPMLPQARISSVKQAPYRKTESMTLQRRYEAAARKLQKTLLAYCQP